MSTPCVWWLNAAELKTVLNQINSDTACSLPGYLVSEIKNMKDQKISRGIWINESEFQEIIGLKWNSSDLVCKQLLTLHSGGVVVHAKDIAKIRNYLKTPQGLFTTTGMSAIWDKVETLKPYVLVETPEAFNTALRLHPNQTILLLFQEYASLEALVTQLESLKPGTRYVQQYMDDVTPGTSVTIIRREGAYCSVYEELTD